MKSIRFITLASLSLLTLGLAGAALAQTPPAGAFGSRVLTNAAPPDEMTNSGSDVIYYGMYGYGGAAGHRPSKFYFNVEGSGQANNYGFAALQFDTQYLKNQLNAAYPAGYTVTGIYVDLYEINAKFTTPGNVLVSFVKDESTVSPFGYKYGTTSQLSDPYTATGSAEPFLEPGGSWTSTAGAAGQEQLESYFFPTTGATGNGTQDLIPLYGTSTGVASINNPGQPASNNTDLLNHFLGNNTLTLAFNADPTTPTVAATWDPYTELYQGVQYYTPQLVVFAKAGSSVTQPPAVPTLSAVADDQKVTLTWTPSTGATSYTLYRSNSSGVETVYQTGLGGTSFTDTGLTNGTTYYYKITASNSAGESAKSNEVSGTPFLNPPLAPVLTASAATGLVQLSWNAPAHAVTYNLYRSTATGTETSYKMGLTKTTFTDFGLTNGTTYYYKVTAVDAAGEGAKSNEASATKIAVSPFTALSADSGNDAADSDLVDEGMYAPYYGNGHRTGATGSFYLNAEGVMQSAGVYDGFFAVRFNTTNIKNQIAENFGAGVAYNVQAISLNLTESNQSFTTPGNVVFNLSDDNADPFGYAYADQNEEQVTDPFGPTSTVGNEELLEVYPFATTGTAHQYSIDSVPLFGSSAIQNPANPAAGTDLLAAFSASANLLTFVARPQDADITGTTTIPATPNVSATWNGAAFSVGPLTIAQPQLAVVVAAAPVTGATVTGSIALEGVANLGGINANAPLGVFDIQIRHTGSVTPLFESKNVTLTTTAGSPNGTFSLNVTGVPAGTYDVWIKGSKNLAVLTPGVTISATSGTVPGVTLPAGDTDNSNTVDSTDFGVFVGAYNSDSAVAGSGYDPTADFNFDGKVDATDFGIFVGDYNTVGAL